MKRKCEVCGEMKGGADWKNLYNHVLGPSPPNSPLLVNEDETIIESQFWICDDCKKDEKKIIKKIIESMEQEFLLE
ncbi:MAG: hypothetical protein ACFFCS_14340 [Candidatus Hodarchaeota archaeon]